MKRLIWAPKARRDLFALLDHISLDDERTADLVAERIEDAVKLLSVRSIGRPGRVSGTYEKPVSRTSQIIVYRLVGADALEIVRIIHMARDWPPGTWPRNGDSEG